MTATKKPEGLALLREPFEAHQISALPKITCKACSDNKFTRCCDKHSKRKCDTCQSWITTAHVDLDYVGHAALTDRLLDTDLSWSWEPVAWDDRGLPAFDGNGGLWMRLTVCGVTRLGYGDAQGKTGPNAVKEAIGDGLRNAAMRFGAALDLWHKGELHADRGDASEDDTQVPHDPSKVQRGVHKDPDPWADVTVTKPVDPVWLAGFEERLDKATESADLERLKTLWVELSSMVKAGDVGQDVAADLKLRLTLAKQAIEEPVGHLEPSELPL